MKKTLFTCFLMLVFSMHSQIIDWEDEIVVAPNTYGNVRPRIVLTNNDEPLVLFGKSSLGLFVSKLENNIFNTPLQVHPTDLSVYMANWTSGDIASHGDSVIIAFKANPLETGHIYSVSSVDGGLSFSDTIRADTHAEGVAWLPCLDMDNNGHSVLSYMVHDPVWVNPRYVYSKSVNLGSSFSPEIDITNNIAEEACDCCPAEIVAKDNREVLLFRNMNQNIRDIYAVYSADNGNNFQYTNAEELNWAVNSCPSTAPDATFLGDRLWSVSASRVSGKYRVYLTELLTNDSIQRVSTDSIFPPDNFNGSQNYPRISSDGDTVVLVWQESNPSNFDIFLSVSINGSIQEMLSQKIMVNSDPSGAQLNPDVVIKNGFIHVVFQDNNGGVVKYRKGKFTSAGLFSHPQSSHVYPNPASEYVQIKNLENMKGEKLRIYDENGQIVVMKKVQTENEKIDTKNLKSGKYSVQIGKYNTQFIVLHQ